MGIFAPQGIIVVVMMVMRRSFSFSMVLVAMTAGTPQPEAISIGMNDFARQAEASEDAVHDEGDARHVTAPFEERQHEEQQDQLRDETNNGADAGDRRRRR